MVDNIVLNEYFEKLTIIIIKYMTTKYNIFTYDKIMFESFNEIKSNCIKLDNSIILELKNKYNIHNLRSGKNAFDKKSNHIKKNHLPMLFL